VPPDEPPPDAGAGDPEAGEATSGERVEQAGDPWPRDSYDLVIEAPGAEEISTIPWPLLFRQRALGRIEQSDRYRWIVLVTALFGLLGVTFTITILAVSIPTIAEEFNTSTTSLTWLITGPVLAFAVVGPAVGKAGDLLGHRRVFVAGLLGATFFAGLTALSWDTGSLIAFRVLGATCGAATGPSSLALINRTFGPSERAKVMGYWSLVIAGGPVLGVVVGGPIVEAFSWRWVFVAQVPLMLAGALVAFAVLPETKRQERTPFDWGGSLLLGTGVTALLVGLNQGPVRGWADPLVVGGFVLSAVLVVSFIQLERRIEYPLIPLEYFKRRNVAFPISVQFFLNFAYMGGFILTPLFLQEVLGFGEAKTGLLSISRPLAFAIAGPVAGYFAVRVGESRSAVIGGLAVALSMVGLSMVGLGGDELLIVGSLALSGIGLGCSMPAMASTIANAVDEGDLGVVGAAQQMMTEVGLTAGIQIMQTVQVSREPVVGALGSYGQAYLVGAGVALLGAICAAFVRSSRNTTATPFVSAVGGGPAAETSGATP
jgi:EmrB/QacA subfamily drug resistance transporter